MDSRRSLEWVQSNRARINRAHKVGAPIRQILTEIEVSGFAASRELADMLSSIVDDEFRQHCRITVAGRRLRVQVDRESLVYPMRMRWHVPLRDVIAGQRRRSGMKEIVFEFGCRGVRLPQPGAGWIGRAQELAADTHGPEDRSSTYE